VAADADTAGFGVCRRPVDDHAHAAEIHVAVVGDELQRGRVMSIVRLLSSAASLPLKRCARRRRVR